jgi:polyisoprenoid-binding protein YceI
MEETIMKRIAACAALALGGMMAAAGTARAGNELLQLTPGNMLSQTHSTAVLFTITGTYRQLSGTLTFDPAAKTCHIDVTFVTSSLALPNAIVRGQVMSKAFLDPKQYPQTSYIGDCAKNGTELDGKLTMHGQTHPFAMKLTERMANGKLVGFDSVGKLDRYNWGLDGLKLMVGKVITVTNDISLTGKPPKPAN